MQWTEKMKNVGQSPALEEATRIAVIKAVQFLSGLVDGDERPTFTGNTVLIAKNTTAMRMQEEITDHLDPSVVGTQRAIVISTAVNAAFFACGGGRKGEDAWGALETRLTVKK